MWKPISVGTVAAVMLGLLSPVTASPVMDEEWERLIERQQQLVEEMSNEGAEERLQTLQHQINELKKKRSAEYDVQALVDALALQVERLMVEIESQTDAQRQLFAELHNLRDQAVRRREETPAPSPLLYPGPQTSVRDVQDAANAQENSTKVFVFRPGNIYKIYCRIGYLTDIELQKGEKLSFVGGGDTAAWMLESSTVDNTPHLYIKPIADSTTNIIINTDKHVYQLLVCASDWYNPMIKWSYGIEEQIQSQRKAAEDERTVTDTLHVSSAENLNFDYRIVGKQRWKPIMVFDDGKKTYIKFKEMSRTLPMLFIKEAQRKQISLVNFQAKDNYYIVDRVFTEAQLKVSDDDVVRIVRTQAED